MIFVQPVAVIDVDLETLCLAQVLDELGRRLALPYGGLRSVVAATVYLASDVSAAVEGAVLVAAWLGALTEALVPGTGHPWFSAGEVLAAALRRTTVTAAPFGTQSMVASS